MASKIVVVTGTDTDVGKTWVTAALARAMRQGGLDVRAVKPAESGCESVDPDPREDGVVLAQAARQETPAFALVRLSAPLAPPAAAEEENVSLDAMFWMAFIRSLSDQADFVLVEGAGGLLSPLTWEITALELAQELDASMLVVAANKLGTLNHTRLTLQSIQQRGIPIEGVVLNSTTRMSDHSASSNLSSLQKVEPGLNIALLPYLRRWQDAVPHLQEVVEWLQET